MTSVNELGRSSISDLDDIYVSLLKTIEIESNKLKEKAELDSSQMVVKAEEKAKQTVEQARQEAKSESERIIAEAEEKAKQTVEQARQEAKSESERIIAEAEESAKQTVKQTRQEAKSESERIIAEAEEKAKQTVELVGQEAGSESERIIAEAEEKAKQTVEQAKQEARIKSEWLASQARQESEKIVNNIKEKMWQVITEVIEQSIKKTKNDLARSASEARRELENETSEILAQLRDIPQNNRDDTRLLKGRIKVEIAYPSFKDRQTGIQHELTQVDGIKVLSTDSYARGDSLIMAHLIEIEQPIPLLKTIKAIMKVKDIAEHQGNVLVIPN